MVISKIYQVIEFTPKACFKEFQECVTDARRESDSDPDVSKKMIAEAMKLLGNSGFGSLCMNKMKFHDVVYTDNVSDAARKAMKFNFIKMSELDEIFEIEMEKTKILLDLPIYLGYFILQYAKLRMLEFYYDFLDKYVNRNDFEYLETDTDSAYFALTGPDLKSVVKKELRKLFDSIVGVSGLGTKNQNCNNQNFEANLTNFIPRECCQKHHKWDNKTPGLFKLEAEGSEMVALCSKTYILHIKKPSSETEDQFKISTKGLMKNALLNPMSKFKSVLSTGKSSGGENRGFQLTRENYIYSYKQIRHGISYLNSKRVVMRDGNHSRPIPKYLSPFTKPNEVLINPSHPFSNLYPTRLVLFGNVFENAHDAFHFKLKQVTGLENENNQFPLNLEWTKIRVDVLFNILWRKYLHSDVRKALFSSKNKKLYYCSEDVFWGIGMLEDKALISDTIAYRSGSNIVGLLWEKIRKKFLTELEKSNENHICSKCHITSPNIVKKRESTLDFQCNDCYETHCSECYILDPSVSFNRLTGDFRCRFCEIKE